MLLNKESRSRANENGSDVLRKSLSVCLRLKHHTAFIKAAACAGAMMEFWRTAVRAIPKGWGFGLIVGTALIPAGS